MKRYQPEGDKVMRMNAQTGAIENGFVYLPRDAAWLADYLHELTTFPNSKYDDQADSTSQALAWINKNGDGRAQFEAFARLYPAVAAPQEESDWTVAARLAGAPASFVRHFERRPRAAQEKNNGGEQSGESIMEIYLRARRRFGLD